jgi:hypothetical protein
MIKTATLDGKNIAYTDETLFEVQIGKNKSSYKTKYSFLGNLGQAVFYYNAINIGRGYKKRLYCRTFNRPTLAKQFS